MDEDEFKASTIYETTVYDETFDTDLQESDMLPPDRAYVEGDAGMKCRRVGAWLAILEFLNVPTYLYESILMLLRGQAESASEFFQMCILNNPSFASQA